MLLGSYFIIYLVPLPLPSTIMTPFCPMPFNNCVVFDFPKGTYGASSLIGLNIVLLKDWNKIPMYYHQANEALLRSNSAGKICSFQEIAFQCMISQCCAYNQSLNVLHPALKILREHDIKAGSDLYRTLHFYIKRPFCPALFTPIQSTDWNHSLSSFRTHQVTRSGHYPDTHQRSCKCQ